MRGVWEIRSRMVSGIIRGEGRILGCVVLGKSAWLRPVASAGEWRRALTPGPEIGFP